MDRKFILGFSEIGKGMVAEVGGKNASLGEMFNQLKPKGISVPDGFAVTASAYRFFLEFNGLVEKLTGLVQSLDTVEFKNLRQVGMAVRSSATAEDLPSASFAGQMESFLNISGESRLLDACRRCFASLFTDRAVKYRVDNGFDHMRTAVSVGVQRMVRSDLAASGVGFTLEPETGNANVIALTGAFGLDENVVQGAVTPDQFLVFKEGLRAGKKALVSRRLGAKRKNHGLCPSRVRRRGYDLESRHGR